MKLDQILWIGFLLGQWEALAMRLAAKHAVLYRSSSFFYFDFVFFVFHSSSKQSRLLAN